MRGSRSGGGGRSCVLLVLAQLLLPRDRRQHGSPRASARYGTVESVHVEAWPAVKLLWGDADSVERARRRRSR